MERPRRNRPEQQYRRRQRNVDDCPNDTSATGLFVGAMERRRPRRQQRLGKAQRICREIHDGPGHRLLQGNLRLAVKRCLDLVMEDKHLSYELRQLALSTCQAFIKRWPASTGNFVWWVFTVTNMSPYVDVGRCAAKQ